MHIEDHHNALEVALALLIVKNIISKHVSIMNVCTTSGPDATPNAFLTVQFSTFY